jgi:plastocyanin
MRRLMPLFITALSLSVWGCQSATQEEQTGRPQVTATPQSEDAPPPMITDPSVAREIEVRTVGMRYEPNRIEVSPGERVRIQLVNDGDSPHNLALELPGGELDFASDLAPGARESMEFTVPEEPGEYTIYCPVGEHREHGMTGVLVVR